MLRECNGWELMDNDCAQYIRKNGSLYEMVQYVWLDTTEEDLARGLHEYVICKTEVDVNDLSEDDMSCAIAAYGYSLPGLRKEYGESYIDLVAECYMEEEIMSDSHIINEANSREEAEQKVQEYIKEVI